MIKLYHVGLQVTITFIINKSADYFLSYSIYFASKCQIIVKNARNNEVDKATNCFGSTIVI